MLAFLRHLPHLPAPFESAEDVDDVLACRVFRPGVLGQERLGYEQVRRQVPPPEPLADEVGEADALVAVDRGEAAAFAVERVGAVGVHEVVAQARAYLVVDHLDELQVAVDGGIARAAAGMVDDI